MISRRDTLPRRQLAPRRRLQKGAGLLEVMISVLIMGIGLLGIAAMQATALRNGQSSLERTQAVIQSYGILDLMRANRTNAIAGYYNTSGVQCTTSAADGSQPVGQQVAQDELNSWLASLKRSMGVVDDETTCAQVSCINNSIGGGTCSVTIQWDDSRGSSVDAGGQAGDAGEGSETRRAVTVSAL